MGRASLTLVHKCDVSNGGGEERGRGGGTMRSRRHSRDGFLWKPQETTTLLPALKVGKPQKSQVPPLGLGSSFISHSSYKHGNFVLFNLWGHRHRLLNQEQDLRSPPTLPPPLHLPAWLSASPSASPSVWLPHWCRCLWWRLWFLPTPTPQGPSASLPPGNPSTQSWKLHWEPNLGHRIHSARCRLSDESLPRRGDQPAARAAPGH